MTEPANKPTPKGSTVAAIAAACAICVPFAASFEGIALRPYRDPAAIVTWCYGETQGKPEAIYTKSQCGDLLRARMARDYAPKVLACLPELAQPQRRHEFAALIDASYNAGPVAVCRSPMVVNMNVGRWAQGCAAFAGWYTTARNRQTGERIRLRGLERRRIAERDLCLKPEGASA